MTVFNIAGRKVQVDPYKTWWPLSVVFKQQGVKIQVNPQTHWWCLWLCTTTDNADAMECSIFLKGAIAPEVGKQDSCTRCGDLTITSDGSVGFSAPWEFQTVDFKGSVRFGNDGGPIVGSLVFS
jgi:hypothetical protein